MRNGDLILEVAKNMRLLADSLTAAVTASGKTAPDAPATPTPESTPVAQEKADAVPVPEKTYTKEEARDILIAIRAKGFNDQIREILTRRGYEKFTAVPPEEYPAIISEAEALVDGSK